MSKDKPAIIFAPASADPDYSAHFPSREAYQPLLDGLRFLAFLLVFIHNSPYLASNRLWMILHEYGWIGVDLFFCLSAYLITKQLTREQAHTGKINISQYYVRRALRIWPAYFFYIVIALIVSYQKLGWDNLSTHIVGLLTFTFNYTFIALFPRAIVLTVHLWSISFEMQYYLALPWIIKWGKNLSDKAKLGLVLLFALSGLFFRALLIVRSTAYPAAYLIPFVRFEALLGGALIGSGLLNSKNLKPPIPILLAGLVLLTLLNLPNINEDEWGVMLTYFLSGLFAFLIVLGLGRNNEGMHFMKNPVLVYLGKISYGLYLFHVLGNLIAGKVFGFLPAFEPGSEVHAVPFFLFSLFVTIVLASASYHMFEKHILKWKEKLAARIYK